MARFFIDRPVFAWVIAIIVMLAGLLSLRLLPTGQFPSVAPPLISITTNYPGADARGVEESVTQVIEQQISGIDNLRYFSSTSDGVGNARIDLTFEQGTDPNIAQVQVQNKVQLATPYLPPAVQRQGLKIFKANKVITMVVSLYSDDGRFNQVALSDILDSKLRDPLGRIKGVGYLEFQGAAKAIRIQVDPVRLANYNLTFGDIKSAVQAQNEQLAAGQIGNLPTKPGQALNVQVTVASRLHTPEEFRAILLRTNPDGSTIRLGDVATVEFGRENYDTTAVYKGKPAAGFAVYLTPGANALDVAKNINATVAEIAKTLPPGVKTVYPYDTTPVVKLAIEQVVHTLIEAIILVFFVMLLFLQSWRATLVPTIAVPVVLLGTCAVLLAAGYSINTLTLFGMVLAIGLLVDDAIVVVENVERHMQQGGLSPKEATRKAMDEVSGALVGIGVVLSAVFLPMAFFSGSAGIIYRQFSITIVTSMALSVLVALILTPALCATLLKPNGHLQDKGFFSWFNRMFDKGVVRYATGLSAVERNWKVTIACFALITGGMALLFMRLPAGFIPNEDQAFAVSMAVLPPGATLEQTNQVAEQVRAYFEKNESSNLKSVYYLAGAGFNGVGQNTAQIPILLKPNGERHGQANSAAAITSRANAAFAGLRAGKVFTFEMPALIELGNAAGFDFELRDVGGVGHDKLIAARNQLLALAAKDPMLVAVRPNGMEDGGQFKVDLDLARAGALGVQRADIDDTISTALGSAYVNDFIDNGRVKRVYVQADSDFRTSPDNLSNLYVRGNSGAMVPFSAFSTTRWITAPTRLERFNGASAVEIVGMPAPGHSTGQAMARMEELARQLPPGIGYAWVSLSYEEKQASGKAPMLYALSILIVFLSLAALYESWSVPLAVILAVPLGVIGALFVTWATGLENTIYLQVGLVTTVGVVAKNAILIVEFAEAKMREGLDAAQAAHQAALLRLRPILMTSFAFILGTLPLAIAAGAGSHGQNAIGRAVVGGMLGGTLLAIFFVPLFFALVKRLFRQDRPDAAGSANLLPQEA